jgi:hypothetical protein
MVEMTVLFKSGFHPGVIGLKELQPWTACAQDIYPANSTDYVWFFAVSCMDDYHSDYQSCLKQTAVPSDQIKAIEGCMNDTSRSSALVSTMNQAAMSGPGRAWPWVVVQGQSLPEPDMHHDDITPFVKAVCAAWTGKPAAVCSQFNNQTSS